MTEVEELIDFFEHCFANFVANHEYPLGYRKGITMLKLTQKHIHAIGRSISLLKSGRQDFQEKKYHKAIDVDLKLMTEVKDMLYQILENPTLPFMMIMPEHAATILDQIEAEPNGAF